MKRTISMFSMMKRSPLMFSSCIIMSLSQ
uniref:Uncharacterized protein n=1 Tax=Anguilla anguilla TaxID=7936 RepID=A0A0E9RZ87_ANGAN